MFHRAQISSPWTCRGLPVPVLYRFMAVPTGFRQPHPSALKLITWNLELEG